MWFVFIFVLLNIHNNKLNYKHICEINIISFLLLVDFFIQGIVANTVGPFNNPTETYPFYSLPFCSGTGRQRRHKQDLGETLSGSR